MFVIHQAQHSLHFPAWPPIAPCAGDQNRELVCLHLHYYFLVQDSTVSTLRALIARKGDVAYDILWFVIGVR